ncbi:MAG: hypothetical protein C0395_02845 [Gemmatimonas sp.]|nr:hypothetical protein [Gemmatimonas sp.]
MSGGALSPAVTVVVLMACLTASAFFSGVETGLMSTSRIRLRTLLRRKPHPRAAALRRLLARIEDPVLSCLIGNNLVNVSFSAVLTAALAARYGDRSEFAAVAIATVLMVIFGEIIPKTVYREYPERLSLASVRPLRAVMLLLAPARWVLLAYSSLIDRLLPGRGHRAEGAVIGREAMHHLMSAHPAAAQDGRFNELLARCLALSDLNLDAVMTPWERVDSLPRAADAATCRRLAAASGYSRLPVLGDDQREVQGWVLVRDLLLSEAMRQDWRRIPDALLRTCPRVDREMSPWGLFEEMRWQRQQMAVVVDAGGNPLGMVTLEDLLEVLVGSIEDEFDDDADRAAG